MNTEADTVVSGASYYALHVALQTLKERCHSLQERLTAVEDENELLRKAQGMDRPDSLPGVNTEDYLRGLVGDLVRQKTQLSEHITMVATENRQLWSRLSKLTKENSNLGLSINKIKDAINSSPGVGESPIASNLIRSKTFTQHSPNPKFRDKCVVETSTDNMSLEEISLQIINKLVEGKENFEQKCEEILETTTPENLCFGGFKGATGELTSADTDVDKCTEHVRDVNERLVQQQTHLRRLLNSIDKIKKPTMCAECQRRQQQPTLSVNSQTDFAAAGDTSQPSESSPLRPSDSSSGLGSSNSSNKTCPMCGKEYGPDEDFQLFQRHVEWHFIDDNESLDRSLDNKAYDMISHTVGNF